MCHHHHKVEVGKLINFCIFPFTLNASFLTQYTLSSLLCNIFSHYLPLYLSSTLQFSLWGVFPFFSFLAERYVTTEHNREMILPKARRELLSHYGGDDVYRCWQRAGPTVTRAHAVHAHEWAFQTTDPHVRTHTHAQTLAQDVLYKVSRFKIEPSLQVYSYVSLLGGADLSCASSSKTLTQGSDPFSQSTEKPPAPC